MADKEDNSATAEIQVFELTMDNPEDQDELNRRLRKPGEPELGQAGKAPSGTSGAAATETRQKQP